MTTNRSRADVRSARRAGVGPGAGPGRRLRVGLALLGLLAIGLTQVGCQSNGCSTCGFGSRLRSNVQALNARLFNREGRGCNTCGAFGSEGGTVVESGVPITAGEVLVPGTVVTPGTLTLPNSGTVVPAPAPGEVSPQLEAIPSPTAGAHAAPVTSTQRPASSTGAASRSAYESVSARGGTAVANRTRRGTTPTHTLAADAPTPAGYSTDEPDMLAQIPPVPMPIELTRRPSPITPSPSAEPAPLPPLTPGTNASAPAAAAAPTASATIDIPTTSAENRSAGGSVGAVVAPGGVTIQAMPGIARSAPVARMVLGGSLPSPAGLEWLRDKGYRTLVDLRSSGEADPTFAERVSDGGMLYVALPFAADPIRLDRLTRFNELLARDDQRPLYFCDADGRRAGLIWYLHLRSVDREEQLSARSQAEEVGFNAALDQARAEAFLKGNFPALAPVPSRKAAAAATSDAASPLPSDSAVALTLNLDIAPASVSQVLDPDPPSLPLDVPASPVVAATTTVQGQGWWH